MSKIKIGDKVRIKESGLTGVIVAREQQKIDGGKTTKVEFIVKTGNGFENYAAYDRKEIERVFSLPTGGEQSTYPRVYNYEHQCADGRTIVLTGIVNKYNEQVTERENYGDFSILHTMRAKKKSLAVGYSICHPSDSHDKNVGAEIAYNRAIHKPLAYFESDFVGEFREEFVTVVLTAKAKFVEENIERFINRDK